MAHKSLSKLCCVLLLFVAPFGYAMTATHNGHSTLSVGSNFNYCLSSLTNNENCWHASATNPLSAVNVSASGSKVYAVDGNCLGHSMDLTVYPHTWTNHPEWGCVHDVQYGDDGNLYALFGTCPGNGAGWELGRWNGSGFDLLTYCFETFRLAPGGYILLTDVNGTLWSGNYTTGNWQHVANAPFPVSQAIPISGDTGSYYALKNDCTIWFFNGSTLSQLPGCGLSISGSVPGHLYAVGSDTAVYHFNTTTNNWDGLVGTGFGSQLAYADAQHVYAIGPTLNGGTVYSFGENALVHTRYYSGSVNGCPPSQGHFCSTALHTVTLYSGIGDKYGRATTRQFTGLGNWAVSASVAQTDMESCVEDNTKCSPKTDGSTICSLSGTIALDSILASVPDLFDAATWFKTVSGPTYVNADGEYIYQVTTYCTAATTPPIWDPVGINGGNPVNLVYEKSGKVQFEARELCINIWGVNLCMPGNSNPIYPSIAQNQDTGPGTCSH